MKARERKGTEKYGSAEDVFRCLEQCTALLIVLM